MLCVAMSTDGEVCYSAGCDTGIRMWQVPIELSDQYDTYGESTIVSLLLTLPPASPQTLRSIEGS